MSNIIYVGGKMMGVYYYIYVLVDLLLFITGLIAIKKDNWTLDQKDYVVGVSISTSLEMLFLSFIGIPIIYEAMLVVGVVVLFADFLLFRLAS
ncbi:hypothetical protein [Acidianus manzaensis]|uniref:Uncharacterized protein n=1 Tax=Acidianus manzaensis TaxID=282676 RepID=A0A1W6K0T2_9CREN|nr:hypothetical protein [Acidianus manzaensis]ARM76138.1 hypothetical protein B6F84_08980 [Acidianus manzaensis]